MSSRVPLSLFYLDNPSGAWLIMTPREREVLTLYMSLYNDKKVARTLGTKTQTVRNQIASIMNKLNAHNRAEIIAIVCSSNTENQNLIIRP